MNDLAALLGLLPKEITFDTFDGEALDRFDRRFRELFGREPPVASDDEIDTNAPAKAPRNDDGN